MEIYLIRSYLPLHSAAERREISVGAFRRLTSRAKMVIYTDESTKNILDCDIAGIANILRVSESLIVICTMNEYILVSLPNLEIISKKPLRFGQFTSANTNYVVNIDSNKAILYDLNSGGKIAELILPNAIKTNYQKGAWYGYQRHVYLTNENILLVLMGDSNLAVCKVTKEESGTTTMETIHTINTSEIEVTYPVEDFHVDDKFAYVVTANGKVAKYKYLKKIVENEETQPLVSKQDPPKELANYSPKNVNFSCIKVSGDLLLTCFRRDSSVNQKVNLGLVSYSSRTLNQRYFYQSEECDYTGLTARDMNIFTHKRITWVFVLSTMKYSSLFAVRGHRIYPIDVLRKFCLVANNKVLGLEDGRIFVTSSGNTGFYSFKLKF